MLLCTELKNCGWGENRQRDCLAPFYYFVSLIYQLLNLLVIVKPVVNQIEMQMLLFLLQCIHIHVSHLSERFRPHVCLVVNYFTPCPDWIAECNSGFLTYFHLSAFFFPSIPSPLLWNTTKPFFNQNKKGKYNYKKGEERTFARWKIGKPVGEQVLFL